MKTFIVLCLIAAASASHLGIGLIGHVHHHVPSGSIGVHHNGAVIAGPSGSVHTDNGLHGHGAGARLSGPAGDVSTHGGHARLDGPGIGHHLGHVGHIGHVAHVVPIHHVVHDHWGHGGVAHGLVGGLGHGIAHGLVGHGIAHGLVGHGIAHGLVGHGHHGW